MLKLNQIYKVKEGHEGKCGSYKEYESAFIKITSIHGNGKDLDYEILNKDKKVIDTCWCFTEDDLELEEEKPGIVVGYNFNKKEEEVKRDSFWQEEADNLELEEEVKEEPLEDNRRIGYAFGKEEVKEDIDTDYNVCNQCKTHWVGDILKCPVCDEKSLEDLEFIECDTCRAKLGTPTLCNGCYHNRTSINRLLEIINGVELSPSEAETLLEEKLGYKVKIKN